MPAHSLLRCLAALSLATACHARPSESALEGSLRRWLADQPGGVAAAFVDAEGVTFATAGKFSSTDSSAITRDTQFEIGSVTKVFTALLLADAVAAQKMRLEDAVGKPFAPSKVTLLQLATHTSGLPRMPADLPAGDPLNPYAVADEKMLVKSFAGAASSAAPSDAASYSNFGFAVLGQAVAAGWGKPYAAALRERVLAPLGLNDTVAAWREADAKRLAPPHNEQGPASNWDMSAFAPAGALVSTTRDLAKFLQACLGFEKTPLAAVLADAARPRVADNSAPTQTGLAWIVEQRGASTIVWHNGGTGGYRSFIGYDATGRVGVALLTNHTTSLDALGMALLEGRELQARRASEASGNAKAYLGNYPLAPSFVIAVTAEGEALFLQATGQPRLKLRALAADRFATLGVDAEVSFERDASGQVAALVLHQGGIDQRAPRLAVGAAVAQPKEAALSEAELDEYVARYRLETVEFAVTRDGARLLVQLTGQPSAQVFASTKDEFFYKVVNAQISFVRERGKVAALVLHQGGSDQRAERVK